MGSPKHTEKTFESRVDALGHRLDELVAARQTTVYLPLAKELGLEPPRQIRTIAALLESIQDRDAARQSPQRAAVVLQRGEEPIPRPGFFHKLVELGLYDGEDRGAQAIAWHQRELKRLFGPMRSQ